MPIRYTKCRTERQIEGKIFGFPVYWQANSDYPGHKGARKIWTASITIRGKIYGFLYQRTLPGFKLDRHTDGPSHNKALWVELWRAREGGKLEVEGPMRSFLFGRLRAFDGGRDYHRVTPQVRGHRVVVMFQKAYGA